MHVLFAAAELAPIVKVGGLGEAACGLVRALRSQGHHVDVALPDYGLEDAFTAGSEGPSLSLDVPPWAGPAFVRQIDVPGVGAVHLIDTPEIRRDHPYVERATGEGWPDNDRRFFAFSRAISALAELLGPDVVHLNDWHTATALASLERRVRTVFSVHNLSYQGWADPGWVSALGDRGQDFAWQGAVNPMAGALKLADRVVAVSPSYAAEIRTPDGGVGLHSLTQACAGRLIGIRNGIDHARWDPATDPTLQANFRSTDLTGRELCSKELRHIAGFDTSEDPVIGVVARLVEQKGIDLALALAPVLATMPARLVLVGDGDPNLARQARRCESLHPGQVWFAPYSDRLARQVAAGADIMLVPSRFEPCGLTQMEAMAYGSVPVVSAVGGLQDAVIDADQRPTVGNGFIAAAAEPLLIADAVHRALRAQRSRRRWQAIQQRGMRTDWSWQGPAAAYAALYRQLCGGGPRTAPRRVPTGTIRLSTARERPRQVGVSASAWV